MNHEILRNTIGTKTRIERDTMGPIQVPKWAYWGAQTQRALENFRIGDDKMPMEIIRALAFTKKASALTNYELCTLPKDKADLIVKACDEIIEGKLDKHFPLTVWQTGSGTQTNMNVNEVISNRAEVLRGGKLGKGKNFLHPNDDINLSQSSNDVFPSAMHIATYIMLKDTTIPGIEKVRNTLNQKATEFREKIKIGRTHWMDAVPMTLGQEFSGYVGMLDHALEAINNSLKHLPELALGGTAVGTGLNCPKDYAEAVAKKIAEFTGLPFVTAPNKFEALSSHNTLVNVAGALNQSASSLNKIANDIRIMASGPRSGIGEITIPENEPGSSIMPGKVNPTQIEALTMACMQTMGSNHIVTLGDMSGFFELNVYKPLIIFNILKSTRLIGDACTSFNDNCAVGISANDLILKRLMENSLMLVTSLSPHIGYDKSASIAKNAHKEGITLKESAIASGFVTAKQYDLWVNPKNMLGEYLPQK